MTVTDLVYSHAIADDRTTLTAEQLDAMTPDERAQAFRDRIVTDPQELPEDFRRRIFDRARQLGTEHADR